MEFGQIFHRLGVKVTVLRRRDRVLPREDEEISSKLEAILQEEGVDVRTGANPIRVEKASDGKLSVLAELAGGKERFACDRILVAAGRRPHDLAQLGLESAGVEGQPDSGIRVDETLHTTALSIWAIEDVLSRMQYTHFAVYTAGIAVANALRNEGRAYDTAHVLTRCSPTRRWRVSVSPKPRRWSKAVRSRWVSS